ncbi:MAG TPA: hypothetical protein VIJ92_02325 [Ginsengibacter sp.]
MKKLIFFVITLICLLIIQEAFSQDNYEIQVYGSEIVTLKATMVELHSNYTGGGSLIEENGVLPTHHIIHETIEITHGFTNWFEVGFYFFNAIGNEGRTNYVGSHIRPRVRVPDNWHWPVGVSLSLEAGYQKLQYSEDDWTLEIRPIIDKTFGKWYIAFNPAFEKSLHGLNSRKGYIFAPNVKGSYNVNKAWAPGLEYYGSVGGLFEFLPFKEQQQQLFAVIDINAWEKWELNFGYGQAFTKAADNGIIKVIVGYRFK